MSTPIEALLEFMNPRDDGVVDDYQRAVLDSAAMQGYKAILQYGKKAGESLFTHALNGVFVLATLRSLLQLDEIETTCDRVLIMDHGRVVGQGRLEELVEGVLGGRRRLMVRFNGRPEVGTFGERFEVDDLQVACRNPQAAARRRRAENGNTF